MELFVRDSAGEYHPADDAAKLTAGEHVVDKMMCQGATLTSPEDSMRMLRVRLAPLKVEVFVVVFLTQRHQVIAVETISSGTIDGAVVHPRVVVQRALAHNAARVMFAHNHPSGDPDPSVADRAITKRLVEALALVDIKCLDHIVVGTAGTVSFAELGYL